MLCESLTLKNRNMIYVEAFMGFTEHFLSSQQIVNESGVRIFAAKRVNGGHLVQEKEVQWSPLTRTCLGPGNKVLFNRTFFISGLFLTSEPF